MFVYMSVHISRGLKRAQAASLPLMNCRPLSCHLFQRSPLKPALPHCCGEVKQESKNICHSQPFSSSAVLSFTLFCSS